MKLMPIFEELIKEYHVGDLSSLRKKNIKDAL